MLVLSRRKDETIMIGDDVEITVVDIRGDTVRLGIQAPKSVSVHRKEIYDAIQAENIAAAAESIPDQSAVGGLGQLLKGEKTASVPSSALDKLSGGLMGLSGLSGLSAPKPPGLDKLAQKLPQQQKKTSIRRGDGKN
jgi:carbon storage regulator